MLDYIYKAVGFKKGEHNIKTEFIAGLTTFVTMSYILAVNPAILSESGMSKGAVFTATALTSALATILMAFWGKLPFAQAPGMAINAFFTFTIVKQLGYTWQTALTIMLVVGIIYTLIVLFNIQKYIVKAIPINLRYAISVAVGLFITFIGLQNSELIVDNEFTLIQFGTVKAKTVIAFVGIILSGVFVYKNIKGGLFISIIVCTIIGLFFGETNIPENFSLFAWPASVKETAFAFDFTNLLNTDVIIVIFTVLFICIFDTMGALLGMAAKTGNADKDGNVKNLRGALLSDSVSSIVGASIGTSAVTTFAESASGIAEGGKSGLTSLFIGILFIVSLLFSSIFLLIPIAATTGSLVIVGVLMINEIKKINFDDMTEALPAFLTIIMIPLTYSIGDGIMIGILSYVLIKTISGRFKETNIAMYILGALILLKFLLG